MTTFDSLEQSTTTFQWKKQWYPVAVVEYLDPTKPHKIKLLGQDLVLWQDKTNCQWHCFKDFCPHRGVPLSEGRIESDGTLMCAYHAWRFSGDGQCVKIPQSKDKETEIKHCQNEKASCMTYPIQVNQGLIWVWAESGSQGYVASKLKQPLLAPELEQKSDNIVISPWMIRDLPYGWDFFFENVCDPAHAPVSHHGFLGNRYTDAKYYNLKLIREISTEEGFAFQLTNEQDELQPTTHSFFPPCLMKIETLLPNGNKLFFILYAIPTKPGWCRHIACQLIIKNQGKYSKGLSIFALKIPAWVNHIISSSFLHQDLVFLHYQEKSLAKMGINKLLDNIYTPNPQDKMVITFRQWFKYRAGNMILWENYDYEVVPTIPEENEEKLFDVWTTHTKNCLVCQKALKRINLTKNILNIFGVSLIVLALFIDYRIIAEKVASNQIEKINLFLNLSPIFIGLFVIALLSFLIGYLLKRLTRVFYVYEFRHSDNN